MSRVRFIDADSHILEPNNIWEKYLEPKFRPEMPRIYTGYYQEDSKGASNDLGFFNDVSVGGYDMPLEGVFGKPMIMPGLGEAYDEYARQGFPPRCYVDAMTRLGIDYMVVYPTAGLYSCAVPTLSAPGAAAIRRAYNNWLHDFCTEAGAQLVGAGSLDLRDPEAAASEATRCVKELGFKAVHINPVPVGEHRLYEPSYDRLWATISDLDVPVGVHVGALNACDQMLYHYLPGLGTAESITAFSIGNMLASAAFIMGGVLERHPKLRVVHLESGAGWAAFWMYRLAAGVQGGFKGLPIPGLKMAPVEYFQRQCYISADPDDPGIKQVIDTIGDDNVVVATDFGHPEGRHYSRAVEEVLALPGVSDASKHKIMWDNALKLYPIRPN
jgi:predicted TIM-barrel fold metal-dependent hydrolase